MELVSSESGWRDEAMPLDQPGGVVDLSERHQRLP
jgi:hypothetical protein